MFKYDISCLQEDQMIVNTKTLVLLEYIDHFGKIKASTTNNKYKRTRT